MDTWDVTMDVRHMTELEGDVKVEASLDARYQNIEVVVSDSSNGNIIHRRLAPLHQTTDKKIVVKTCPLKTNVQLSIICGFPIPGVEPFRGLNRYETFVKEHMRSCGITSSKSIRRFLGERSDHLDDLKKFLKRESPCITSDNCIILIYVFVGFEEQQTRLEHISQLLIESGISSSFIIVAIANFRHLILANEYTIFQPTTTLPTTKLLFATDEQCEPRNFRNVIRSISSK
jgi:hypothetical protein